MKIRIFALARELGLDSKVLLGLADDAGILDICCGLGRPVNDDAVRFTLNGQVVLESTRTHYQRVWAETSYQVQRIRDNSDCADEEFEST